MSTKTYTVEIPEKPFLPFEGTCIDQTFEQFVATSGGELATALFEGKMKSVLYQILSFAHARGKNDYHKQLVQKAQEKARPVAKKR